MIDEEKYKTAVAKFLKNPSWRKEYDAAPTEVSKRYEGLMFYLSEYAEEIDENDEMMDDLKKEMNKLEEEMGLEDWKYLYKYCGNNPNKTKYREKVKQLGGGEWLEGHDGAKIREKGESASAPRRDMGLFRTPTYERVEFSDGYVLTFHQNLTPHDAYGGYTDEIYAMMCAITMEEVGSSEPLIAFYGHSETQFHCAIYRKSVEFSVRHNQYGLWNCEKGRCEVNPDYHGKTNPLIDD